MKEGVREGLRDISCPLSLSDLPRSLSPADERRPGGQGCWQLAWPRQPSAPSQKYRVVRTASCDRQIHARMCAGEHQRQSLCASMCAHIVSRERACRDRVRERERERERERGRGREREREKGPPAATSHALDFSAYSVSVLLHRAHNKLLQTLLLPAASSTTSTS